MSNEYGVGKRLDEEILRLFGTKREAAKKMGLSDGSYFNTYTSGRATIGGIFQRRLSQAGFDVQYILSGVRSDALATCVAAERCCADIDLLNRRLQRVTAEMKDISESLELISKQHSS